jgi:ABC-type phosphate transport system substrate-binding protein
MFRKVFTMQKATVLKSGVVGAVALALSLGMVAPAMADVQPQTNDAVGVGSDTVQYVGDFLADGDYNSNPGWNNGNLSRRMFSFDATTDGSGRAVYGPGGVAITPTVVLRAGTAPVSRPNGSGGGISALLADSTHKIDFVRSSRLPNAGEIGNANAVAFGGFRVFQVATDDLRMATASTTNAVPLSAADLWHIYKGDYTTWSDVPSYAGTHGSETIIPLLPQPNSGTRNDFLGNLNTQTGLGALNTTTPGNPNIRNVEEHDPTGITSQPSGDRPNVIDPFSVGRQNLINSGYLAPVTMTGVSLQSGTGWYDFPRFLYLVSRENDFNAVGGWVAGSSTNKIKALFGSATSWAARPANAPLYTAAGVTQAWVNKGNNPTS